MIRRLLLPVAVLPGTLLLLAGALVAPALAGGGCHGGAGAEASEASSSVVKIDGCAFVPTIDRVQVGAEITFLNSGMTPHDVTGTMGTWGSRLLEPGASWSTRFASPGIYAYSCSLHPGMAGVIVAGAGEGAGAAAANVGSDGAQVSDVPLDPGADTADGGSSASTAAAFGGAGLVVGVLGTGLLLRRRRQE